MFHRPGGYVLRARVTWVQMLYPVAATPLLNEIHGGNFAGMDRTSWREQYPEMWEQREQDKLAFRFPGAGGESYQDVIQRVQPIIVELERQASLCVFLLKIARPLSF